MGFVVVNDEFGVSFEISNTAQKHVFWRERGLNATNFDTQCKANNYLFPVNLFANLVNFSHLFKQI